ncbi:MAG TPA: alkaline phosphatase family protein [Acidimicrobiales bacterium]|nr:alkaline phosphatase family protein [Acidimicrobiales bacterium]
MGHRDDAPGGGSGRPDAGARLSRRALLGAAAAGAAGVVLAGGGSDSLGSRVTGGRHAVARLASAAVRQPGSLPNPAVAPGTESLPEIEHIIVVMMENHSFDNLLGMTGRGDGFPLGRDGLPTAACPDGKGNLVHAFHMPSECMTSGVGNDWQTGHRSYDNGSNLGFVEASTGESMGYFLDSDIPFTCGLASTFPIADRWFCSAMAQTNPNRRYLFAGTSLGLINDSLPSGLPPNGTIFDSLNKYGISWKDYYSDNPSPLVFISLAGTSSITDKFVKMEQFFSDAAAGTLPQFSVLEPNYTVQSEENPQDIQFGDQYLADVVNAVLLSPAWPKTLMIWTYDEWGGWYDHVPPPAAIPPDDIPPDLAPGFLPGGFDRYGFRVPAGVISPYARRHYVSHTVYDHTSILKTVETKWNLPALTRRDANAADVLDMIDLRSAPAFLTAPRLPDPANPAGSYRCLATGPGPIPPPSAVRPA